MDNLNKKFLKDNDILDSFDEHKQLDDSFLSKDDEEFLENLKERLSSSEDNDLSLKINKILDCKEFSNREIDLSNYEKSKKTDNYFLYTIILRLENSNIFLEDRRFFKEVKDILDIVEFDTIEEYNEYRQLYYKVQMLLENRSYYEKYFGIQRKIQRLLKNKKLRKKDFQYNGFEEFEQIDNYILDMVQKLLKYKTKRVPENIRDCIKGSYNNRKEDQYNPYELFINDVIYEVLKKIIEEKDLDNQENLIKIINEYHINYDKSKENSNNSLEFTQRDKSLLSLLIYAYYDGVSIYKDICQKCKTDKYYKYIVEDKIPTVDELTEFIDNKDHLILIADMIFTVYIDSIEDYDYNLISVDPKIIRDRNRFIINRNDIRQLLDLIPKKLSLSEAYEQCENLSQAGYNILINNNITSDEKIRFTKFLEQELIKSKQEELFLDDNDVLMLTEFLEPNLFCVDGIEYSPKSYQFDLVFKNFSNNTVFDVNDQNQLDDIISNLSESSKQVDLASNLLESNKDNNLSSDIELKYNSQDFSDVELKANGSFISQFLELNDDGTLRSDVLGLEGITDVSLNNPYEEERNILSITRNYVDDELEKRQFNSIKKANCFLDYLKEIPDKNGYTHDIENEIYTTKDNHLLYFCDIHCENSDNDQVGIIKKVYSSKDKKKSITRIIDDYKQMKCVTEFELPINEYIAFENEINLYLIANNIKQFLNFQNNTLDKQDNLLDFMFYLRDQIRDIEFTVEKIT